MNMRYVHIATSSQVLQLLFFLPHLLRTVLIMPSSYRLTSLLLAIILAFAATCHARSCPPVWNKVAADLRSSFAGCPSEARQAMRAAFHDCFPGSCDGSLILANECLDREENVQMQPICELLGEKAIAYNVSTADMIQAAAGKRRHASRLA